MDLCDEKHLWELIKSFEEEEDTPLRAGMPIWAKLIERCKSGDVEYKISKDRHGNNDVLKIFLPSGREKTVLTVRYRFAAQALLCVPFESTHALRGYRAFYSYDGKFIEAAVAVALSPREAHFSSLSRLKALLRSGVSKENDNERFEISDERRFPNVRVSIGRATSAFKVLDILRLPFGGRMESIRRWPHSTTIRVEGISLKGYDEAKSLIEKFANAVFFQLDLLTDLPIHLAMNWHEFTVIRPRRRRLSEGRKDIVFPKYEYDSMPMSLYWYASTAEGMPLLQYLAYYQVIEFYFPAFAEKEAHAIAQRMLKDPSFNVDREVDVSRLLITLKPYLAKSGFGNERSALLATIRACVTEHELREFFHDEHRREFYENRSKLISPEKISVNSDKADIVTEVANRIYDIRCKIVHAKPSLQEGEADILLPFSKETRLLGFDIELVRFIARKVLIASSKPFSLPRYSG